jgi:hypothetical protein
MRHGFVVLLLLVAGCTGGSPSPPQPSPPPAPAASRDCATGAEIRDWETGLPQAGPVAFAPLDYSFGSPITPRDPDAAGYRPYKIALLLRTGAEATVTIPAAYREHAKLTYLPGSDHSVRFVACTGAGDGDTDFAGGIAIREPVCLPVAIAWNGRTAEVVLAFGADACPNRPA